MLEGKTINAFYPCGGMVAGQPKYYELRITGGIMTITKQKEVEAIDRVLKEARRMKVDVCNYLQYCIDQQDLFA